MYQTPESTPSQKECASSFPTPWFVCSCEEIRDSKIMLQRRHEKLRAVHSCISVNSRLPPQLDICQCHIHRSKWRITYLRSTTVRCLILYLRMWNFLWEKTCWLYTVNTWLQTGVAYLPGFQLSVWCESGHRDFLVYQFLLSHSFQWV